MANFYIGITNWSEVEIKGLHINDRLVRTFCSCGYVCNSIIDKCPSCGNTEFQKGGKMIKSYHLEDLDPATNYNGETLAIVEESFYYDVLRNKSSGTKITKCNQPVRKCNILNSSETQIRMFWDDERYMKFPPYAVSKALKQEYPNDANYYNVLRACLGLYKEDKDNFSLKYMKNYLNELGESPFSKISVMMNYYSIELSKVPSRLAALPDISRTVCDNTVVFSDFIHNRYNFNVFADYESVLELIYAYWHCEYISPQTMSTMLNAIAMVPPDKKAIPALIKFIKEEYAAIAKRGVSILDFLNYLQNDHSGTIKEYFLNKNIALLSKVYKKRDIDNALIDAFNNPVSLFIELAKK